MQNRYLNYVVKEASQFDPCWDSQEVSPQDQRLSLLGPQPTYTRWLQWLTGALLDSPRTSLTQPDQVSLLDPPQVSHNRVSDTQFHKAIYSWNINTETACFVPTKQRLGFYTHCACRKFLLFLQSTPFLLSLPVSIHLAATTCLHTLC